MDFRELNYIRAIAQYQTISKAAEHLYISQPTLSTFLQRLENTLGVPLFERTNKVMYPTYAGRRYLEYAEQILRNQAALQDELRGIVKNQNGCLSVGSTPTRTRYIAPDLLTSFHRKYPEYRIEVKEAPADELLRMLDEHLIDYALLTIHARDKLHIYHHLSWEEVVLCASKECGYKDLAVHRDGFLYPWIDLNLLKDELFLLVPENWRAGRAARRCFSQIGITPRSISFSVVETAVAAAGSGLGIGFCPDIMIKRGTFSHTPDYFSVGENPSHVEFVLVHRSDYQLTAPLKDFITMCQDTLGANDV